jgi:hypothetical protein
LLNEAQKAAGFSQNEVHKMTARRSFSADDIPTKAADYHGLAGYIRTTPDVAAKGVQSMNIYFNFEEALRLSLALQSCVLALNKYKRSSRAGRDMGLLLSFKTESKTVTVIEAGVSLVREPKSVPEESN